MTCCVVWGLSVFLVCVRYLDDMKKMFDSPNQSDVTFIVEGKPIYASKVKFRGKLVFLCSEVYPPSTSFVIARSIFARCLSLA